jgi:hypothetical protein
MTFSRAAGVLALAATFIALAHSFAWAGMMSPCTAPGMFPESHVTVFVFPFVDYTTPESSQVESPVGTELAGLIQADTLLAISRFGRVAAVRMLGRPLECRPELVLEDLMREFGSGRPDRAVVMVWGRIFRADNEIYVQSYASFRRFVEKDPGEMIQFPLGQRGLAAQLATQTLTFSPRHVSEEDLKQIRDQFAKENIVHERPDEQSPGKPLLLLFPQERRPAYYMSAEQGNWIRIHTQTGQQGWILARAMLGQKSLSVRLPEMRFVEGIAGYFGFRAGPTPAKAEMADAAFRAFEDSPLSATAPAAVAVSKQLRGMLVLLVQNQSDAAFDRAASLLVEATNVLPSNSAVSNMASVVEFYREWKQPNRKLDFEESINRFWVSVSANPDDQTPLTNCWTLFDVARNPDFHNRFTFKSSVSVQDLARRAHDMEKVQVGGREVRLAHARPVVAWPSSQ